MTKTNIASKNIITLVDQATVAVPLAGTNAYLTTICRLTAAGSRTLAAPTNPTDGQVIEIQHRASGGDRTLTLTTGSAGAFRYGTSITAPLTATTINKMDRILAEYVLDDDRWDVFDYVKGF